MPLADEVVLTLRKLDRVISFDAASGVLVCEAPFAIGMPRPGAFDLGTKGKGSCLVGGNVATKH